MAGVVRIRIESAKERYPDIGEVAYFHNGAVDLEFGGCGNHRWQYTKDEMLKQGEIICDAIKKVAELNVP